MYFDSYGTMEFIIKTMFLYIQVCQCTRLPVVDISIPEAPYATDSTQTQYLPIDVGTINDKPAAVDLIDSTQHRGEYLPLNVDTLNDKHANQDVPAIESPQAVITEFSYRNEMVKGPDNTNFKTVNRFHDTTTHIPTAPPATTTTENPLAKLLDKLYGNGSWRALLENTETQTTKLTNHSLAQTVSNANAEQAQWLQGVYNNQIPISNLSLANRQSSTNNTTTSMAFIQKYEPKLNPVLKVHKHDKSMYNASKQEPTEVKKIQNLPISQFHPLSITPVPAQMTDQIKPINSNSENTINQWSNTFKPGQSNTESTSNHETSNTVGGTSTYDANKVSNQQETFHPDRVFITQTGSDPANTNLHASFNANDLNHRFMEQSGGPMHSPPGVKEAIPRSELYGKTETDYQFNANSGVQPQLFNANTLIESLFKNQELLSSNGDHLTGGQTKGYQQAKTQTSQVANMHNINQPHQNEHAHNSSQMFNDTSLNIVTPVIRINPETSKPSPPNFNFVPGNLFPGQLSNSNSRSSNNDNIKQPSFLQNNRQTNVAAYFNPNKMNVEQTLYNPNSHSWLQNKQQRDLYLTHTEDEVSVITNSTSSKEMTSTNPSQKSTQTPLIPTSSFTSALLNKTTAATTTSPAFIVPAYSHGLVFNPNLMNSAQGKHSFLPGQMAPSFNGYGSYSYKQGQQNTNTVGSQHRQQYNMYNPNSFGGGKGMYFGLGNLLGMNNGERRGNNTRIFGVSSGNHSSGYNTDRFGLSFSEMKFDPNKANIGFGSVLGDLSKGSLSGLGFAPNQPGNSTSISKEVNNAGFGMGMFDPNAANSGFGAEGFRTGGFGETSLTFDTNAVNELVNQSHIGQSNSGNQLSVHKNMMNFFLGTFSTAGKSNIQSSKAVGQASFIPSRIGQDQTSQSGQKNPTQVFNPFDVMIKLMSSYVDFKPGNVGSGMNVNGNNLQVTHTAKPAMVIAQSKSITPAATTITTPSSTETSRLSTSSPDVPDTSVQVTMTTPTVATVTKSTLVKASSAAAKT